MNRYVIIVDKSAGNEVVGEMWQETKIFEGNATLDEVMNWAIGDRPYSNRRIIITKPHEGKDEKIYGELKNENKY